MCFAFAFCFIHWRLPFHHQSWYGPCNKLHVLTVVCTNRLITIEYSVYCAVVVFFLFSLSLPLSALLCPSTHELATLYWMSNWCDLENTNNNVLLLYNECTIDLTCGLVSYGYTAMYFCYKHQSYYLIKCCIIQYNWCVCIQCVLEKKKTTHRNYV